MDNGGAMPATGAAFPKFEELGLETNFLKLGDQVFAVKQIGKGFDIDAEMREFYKVKVDTLTQLTASAVVKDINQEHEAQIRRIQDARSRGQIAIPRSLIGKCVAYTQAAGEVMECVPVVYHPWQVIGTKTQLRDYFQAPNTGQWAAINGSDETAVTIQNSIYVPAFVGIGRKTSHLYMLGGIKTPHTMTGGNLCIGSSSFAQYAGLARNPMELSKQISIINLFSPAQSNLRFTLDGEETAISFDQLFREMSTITKVEKIVRSSWQIPER